MALPIRKDSHAAYTDKLVYLSARLAADLQTEALANEVDAVLERVEQANRKLMDARRAEMRARALRDFSDERGTSELEKYRRRLAATEDAGWFVRRLFPGGGVSRAARGRMQIDRIKHLRARTQEQLASPHLASHPEAAELRVTLEHARGVLTELSNDLEAAVVAWEARYREFEHASDAYESVRDDGVERVNALLVRLGGLVGSSAAAAFTLAMPEPSPEAQPGSPGDATLAAVVFGAAQ